MAAPLMLGTSVWQMTQFDIATYSNKAAIKVNQDSLGTPGKLVLSNCPRYPRFAFHALSNGSIDFQADFHGTLEGFVSCGRNGPSKADGCEACGSAPGTCGGTCSWQQGGCHAKPSKEIYRVEDRHGPWRRSKLRALEQMQCQQ
eukprot:3144264-Amphidinium_carterae.1